MKYTISKKTRSIGYWDRDESKWLDNRYPPLLKDQSIRNCLASKIILRLLNLIVYTYDMNYKEVIQKHSLSNYVFIYQMLFVEFCHITALLFVVVIDLYNTGSRIPNFYKLSPPY